MSIHLAWAPLTELDLLVDTHPIDMVGECIEICLKQLHLLFCIVHGALDDIPVETYLTPSDGMTRGHKLKIYIYVPLPLSIVPCLIKYIFVKNVFLYILALNARISTNFMCGLFMTRFCF